MISHDRKLSIFLFLLQWENVKMSKKQTPSDFLKQIIGRPVMVKLNSGVDYRGMIKTQLINRVLGG